MKVLKLNLLENAKSSLRHAVLHLSKNRESTVDDYKYAISDVVHAVELLFKEKLKRIHPAFMWQKVERYPDKGENTVSLKEAIQRLARIANVKFTKKHLDNVKSIKEIRNKIEHYEFEIDEKLAKTYIGRILSFIFWFSQEQLSLDWEDDFKNDESWYSLVSMYQFFEEHVAVVEERMFKEQRHVTDCPECGAYTFDFDLERCEMCGERNEVGECEDCGSLEFEYKIVEVDKQVDEHDFITQRLCESCAAPPYDND
ncbi:MAG: hypothetical protein KAJ79_07025 [Candidatus Omnitrophica bacterium]|nr:hypothetical protein [Candidatus Omnitrophota bacterium]